MTDALGAVSTANPPGAMSDSGCLYIAMYIRHTHYTHCTTRRDDSDDDSIDLQLDL